MDQSSATIRPGRSWYAISLLLLIGGIGLAIWQMRGAGASMGSDARPVRGSGLIQLDEAGTYSLYVYRGASRREDEVAIRALETASSAQVTVHNEQTGGEVAVRDVYETTEMQNTVVARLVEFNTPAGGTYVVKIEPPLDVLKPVVKPGASLEEFSQGLTQFLRKLVLAFSIGTTAAFLAAVWFLVVLVRRKRCQQRLAMGGGGQ